MNREKLAWIVSILLMALLAFDMPATLAQRDDDYKFVRTLVDIHRQVVNNYVEPVDANKLQNGAIDGMLGQLDPYSIYVPPERESDFSRQLEGNFKGVGIQLHQKDNGDIEIISPIDESPAYKAGVKAGDILLKVNGESLAGLKIDDAAAKIKGKINTDVTLTVKHLSGKVMDLTMQRQEITVPTVLGFSRNPDDSWNYFVSKDPRIAYVRITQFTSETFEKLHPIINSLHDQGMQGLILDLRWNPGGMLDEAEKVVNMFLPPGKVIVTTRGRSRPEVIAKSDNDNKEPDFPMIVLVNGSSASAAEIVSGSLKDNSRAVIVGMRSFGKGSVQEIIHLDGNAGELKLTVAYYYLPSGRLVHRVKDAKDWGVNPNVQVALDKNDEEKIHDQLDDQELPYHAIVKAATQIASGVTQPATAPAVDTQLDAAENQLIGFLVKQKQQNLPTSDFTAPYRAQTQPTSAPTTDPDL